MWAETFFRRFFAYLQSRSKLFNFCIGMVCASVVVFLDAIDNEEYSFSFFYMFPISFTTWFAGRFFGILLSLIASFAWTVDNHTHYSTALIWNSVSTIGVFITVSILVNRVRFVYEQERELSRRDFLTGCLNIRAFQEKLEYEINRLNRDGNPLTLAYVDLDNFKEINDMYGHLRGDELLKCIADSFSGGIRKTDVVARIGGDEFVVLLHGTNQDAAQVVMKKIREKLLDDMKKNHWPTTFSIGVVTCLEPPKSSEELITIADNMMYNVKLNGKNGIRYTVFPSVSM